MKRMQHPLHGFHHCYTPQEEEAMRVNGWVDEEEIIPVDPVSDLFTKSIETRDKIRGNRKAIR